MNFMTWEHIDKEESVQKKTKPETQQSPQSALCCGCGFALFMSEDQTPVFTGAQQALLLSFTPAQVLVPKHLWAELLTMPLQSIVKENISTARICEVGILLAIEPASHKS